MSHAHPTLAEQLSEARIVMSDPVTGLFLAWHGGHGIHAYTLAGQEVSYWQVDGHSNHANPNTIRASMRRAIRNEDYP